MVSLQERTVKKKAKKQTLSVYTQAKPSRPDIVLGYKKYEILPGDKTTILLRLLLDNSSN